MIEITKDLVVAGGGVSGLCCALQAARLGLQVALVEASGYLGGNASPEVRVNINGADGTSEFNLYARTGGILDEIILENLYRNPQGNAFHFEALLEDVAAREPNLQVFLNTAVDGVEMDATAGKRRIGALLAVQWKEEKHYRFSAPLFADHTGEGSVGKLAGAAYHKGREAAGEYGESLAPEKADNYVLLGTLIYRASDRGKPVQYVAPDCAWRLEETDVLKYREIPQHSFASSRWFYEIGGGTDPLEDGELMKQHRALVYSIWDYVKNSGNYPAKNYDLDYVSCTIGKREDRRFLGGYLLRQQDLTERRRFSDCIGFGGWSIDLHAVHGILDHDLPNRHYYLPGIYQIPYRCCYAADTENLFLGGRCASMTHVAHGSARVMGTLCTMGQAAGAAAFLCRRLEKQPEELTQEEVETLRQLLLEYDAFVPGAIRQADLAAQAEITASSVLQDETVKDLVWKPLEQNFALLLPVAGGLEELKLSLQATEKTEVEVRFWRSAVPEGYDPGVLLETCRISLEQGEASWQAVKPRFLVENQFVFVELQANAAVKIGCSSHCDTVALTLCRNQNKEENIWDAVQGCRKEYVWEPAGFCLGYQAKQKATIYGADQMVNGRGRVCGLANCWRSAADGQPQKLILQWPTHHGLEEIRLRFTAEYNRRIYSHLDWNQVRILPEITADYRVYAVTEAGRVCLADQKDNFRRENRIACGGIVTDRLEIELYRTNGAPYFSVDEILIRERV